MYVNMTKSFCAIIQELRWFLRMLFMNWVCIGAGSHIFPFQLSSHVLYRSSTKILIVKNSLWKVKKVRDDTSACTFKIVITKFRNIGWIVAEKKGKNFGGSLKFSSTSLATGAATAAHDHGSLHHYSLKSGLQSQNWSSPTYQISSCRIFLQSVVLFSILRIIWFILILSKK